MDQVCGGENRLGNRAGCNINFHAAISKMVNAMTERATIPTQPDANVVTSGAYFAFFRGRDPEPPVLSVIQVTDTHLKLRCTAGSPRLVFVGRR